MFGLILIASIWAAAAQLDPDGAFGGYHDLPMPDHEIVLTGAYVPPWAADDGATETALHCVD